MHKTALALCVAGLALAPLQPVLAQKAQTEQASKKVNAETKNFVKNARIGGAFEIASSQLALEKSQNAEIRAFAERMVTDHTKASEELEQTVQSAGLMVDEPKTADKLDSKHQQMLDKLRAANGAQFERQYTKMQQDAHKEAVTLFSGYAKNGDDAALKAFAQKALPTLKEHQKHVTQMNMS
jgi:putative membrane protein